MNEGETMETGSDMAAVVVKGTIGLLALGQGVAINNLKDVNVILQTVSLTLGIVVALAAIVSIVRKKKGSP